MNDKKRLPIDEREEPHIPGKKKKKRKVGWAVIRHGFPDWVTGEVREDIIHVAKTEQEAKDWQERYVNKLSFYKNFKYKIVYKAN